MLFNKFYDLTENDYSFLDEVTEYEQSISGTFEEFSSKLSSSDKHLTLLFFIKSFVDRRDYDGLAAFIGSNAPLIADAASRTADIGRITVVALKFGVAEGNGNCACTYGVLYYLGEVVEQDFDKARQLYELSLEDGCTQAAINLGYIYEYGRCGEPDYPRAFSYYAYAAALDGMAQAIYKLGDFYYYGRAGVEDKWLGWELWGQAYDTAQEEIDRGCAAFRMAEHFQELYEHPSRDMVLEALQYYQEAEIGFIAAIDAGLGFYKPQLERAVAGQAEIRQLLSDTPF
jgi:hypothetical protein